MGGVEDLQIGELEIVAAGEVGGVFFLPILDEGIGSGGSVFEAEFDAFTGEVLCSQVFHDTLHGQFLQMVEHWIETR